MKIQFIRDLVSSTAFQSHVMPVIQRMAGADTLSKIWASLATASIVAALKAGTDKVRKWKTIKQFDEDSYTPKDIKRRAAEKRSPYVRPDCQANIPTNDGTDNLRKGLFTTIDQILMRPLRSRLILILADTGMGKSTFLEEYYSYHWTTLKRRRLFKISVIPLGGNGPGDLLRKIDPQERGEIVLLLDGIDEDSKAIDDFDKRIKDIGKLAEEFYAVVATCRTQFLVDSNHIPEGLEILAAPGPAPLQLEQGPPVRQIYISPLSSHQVSTYLSRRYPLWKQPIARMRAERAANRFRDLVSRPLLLSFIQDIAASRERPAYTFQIYKQIVDSWISREQSRLSLADKKSDELVRFAERVAVNLFSTGRDRMPSAELEAIAERYNVLPILTAVRERSLIHNDANDNWKFVHGSIMEYFLSTAAFTSDDRQAWPAHPWPDQMRMFVSEMLTSGERTNLREADLRGLDMKGVDLSGKCLSHADLMAANMTDATLLGTDLSDANLTRASLIRAQVERCDFRGATLLGTDIRTTDLSLAKGLTLSQAVMAIAGEETLFPSRLLEGRSETILCLCISRDDRKLIAGSDDGSIRFWTLPTYEAIFSFRGHTGPVTGVAATVDWATAASSSKDGTVRLWDIGTRTQLRVLNGHEKGVNCVVFSSDGCLALSGSDDRSVKIWNVTTGEQLGTLIGHSGPVKSVAITPDGSKAISASKDGTLVYWDLHTRSEIRTLLAHSAAVNSVVISQDGLLAFSGSDDATVRVWDLEVGTNLCALRGHNDAVRGVASTRDGRHVISASADTTVKVWEMAEITRVITLRSHSKPVCSVVVSNDGSFLIAASEERPTRVWFAPEAEDIRKDYKIYNAELFEQQRRARRGPTPEILLTPSLDNSRLVKADDPSKRRQLRRLTSIGMFITVMVGPYAVYYSSKKINQRLDAQVQFHEEMLSTVKHLELPAGIQRPNKGFNLETMAGKSGRVCVIDLILADGRMRSAMFGKQEWSQVMTSWDAAKSQLMFHGKEEQSFGMMGADTIVKFSVTRNGSVVISMSDTDMRNRYSLVALPEELQYLDLALQAATLDLQK